MKEMTFFNNPDTCWKPMESSEHSMGVVNDEFQQGFEEGFARGFKKGFKEGYWHSFDNQFYDGSYSNQKYKDYRSNFDTKSREHNRSKNLNHRVCRCQYHRKCWCQSKKMGRGN